jgi:hypothetical protein
MDRPRLIRGLRIVWSVWWGILCVLLIVLWVRSLYRNESLTIRLSNKHIFMIESLRGELSGGKALYNPDVYQESWSIRSRIRDESKPWLNNRFQDLPWYRGVFGLGYANSPSIQGVGAPYWFFACLTLSLLLLPWIGSRSTFSLRTLLIATTLIAVVLGLVVWSSS